MNGSVGRGKAFHDFSTLFLVQLEQGLAYDLQLAEDLAADAEVLQFLSADRHGCLVQRGRGLGDTDGKRRDLVSCASVRVRLGEREKDINDPVAFAQISLLDCFLILKMQCRELVEKSP